MAVWELVAYNTDSRYRQDIRYREYTTSKVRAEAFGRIPKIQFTDSGHGIVFDARPHKGHLQPAIRALSDYVTNHLTVTKPAKRRNVNLRRLNDARWAACNTRFAPDDFDSGGVPTMEKAAEVADNAVRAYLGIDVDEWREAVAV